MKRVFVVCSRPLLGQGIEHLLAPEAGIEIVGRGKDLAGALPLIGELCPDAVLVACDAGEDALAHLCLRMLSEGTCARVVALDTRSNALSVYWGRQSAVGGVDDLVEAVSRD